MLSTNNTSIMSYRWQLFKIDFSLTSEKFLSSCRSFVSDLVTNNPFLTMSHLRALSLASPLSPENESNYNFNCFGFFSPYCAAYLVLKLLHVVAELP